MEIIDVTPKTEADWERIYLEAFPEYEQRPIADLVAMSDQQSGTRMQVVTDEDQVIGVLYLCEIGVDKAFVLYFAMDAKVQSKGYGSRTLAILKERYPKGLILEAEKTGHQAENEEQRVKRYAFYKRNGFEDKQLLSENSGGIFHLLATTEDVTATEYLQAMQTLSIDAVIRRG